jgi:hypothetical protein
MSYNSTLHEGLGSKGLQAGATTDASEFPSLGSADQFPSLGNGSRAIGGASPGVAGVGVGASSPGLPGSSRGAALGGGSGSTGLGMPQFGMQGNLIYGKKQGGKREGFNAMSEDMFPSLPGVKLKLGGSPLELDDDPTCTSSFPLQPFVRVELWGEEVNTKTALFSCPWTHVVHVLFLSLRSWLWCWRRGYSGVTNPRWHITTVVDGCRAEHRGSIPADRSLAHCAEPLG